MPITVQAALLGVVQGLTEFLPVSSSAHLILARAFFGFDESKFGLAFDVASHVGTLIAVLIYFRREVAQMVAGVPLMFRPGPAEAGHYQAGHDGARLIWLLVVGTIPAVIVGGLFNDLIEEHLRTPRVAAMTLTLGAIALLVAERAGDKNRTERSLTMAEAFWIGCAQALALIPGVSRSGATLTIAILLGLARPDAARFIFLLSIPAILGAALHVAPAAWSRGLGGEAGVLFFIGVVVSAIVGYAAVKYFIRYLAKHSLDVFAWYRLALAATVVVWSWRA